MTEARGDTKKTKWSQLTIRIPEILHKKLKKGAAKEGTSLNHYCTYLLSKGVGMQAILKDARRFEGKGTPVKIVLRVPASLLKELREWAEKSDLPANTLCIYLFAYFLAGAGVGESDTKDNLIPRRGITTKSWTYKQISEATQKTINLLIEKAAHESGKEAQLFRNWAYGVFLMWEFLTCNWREEGDEKRMEKLLGIEKVDEKDTKEDR